VAWFTHYLSKRRLDKDKSDVSDEMGSAITGRWVGTVHQDEGLDGRPMDYPCTLDLRLNGKSVVGSGKVNITIDGISTPAMLKIDGGFYKDRFFRLEYINTDRSYLHFGAFILRLDSIPTKMQGRFCGYGAFSKKIIGGNLEFEKAS
jgi:hypothetical protein